MKLMDQTLFLIVLKTVILLTHLAFVTIEDVTNLGGEIHCLEIRGEVIGPAVVKKHEMNSFGGPEFGKNLF